MCVRQVCTLVGSSVAWGVRRHDLLSRDSRARRLRTDTSTVEPGGGLSPGSARVQAPSWNGPRREEAVEFGGPRMLGGLVHSFTIGSSHHFSRSSRDSEGFPVGEE